MNDKEKTIVEREEEILKFWKENKIFEKSLEKSSPKGEFVFYDGPPFATGLPHFGHLLGSTVKDLFPRYKTMQGYYVRRRWGWDCHGLPIENIVEKKLGLKRKKDIEKLGIEKFNEECRSQVLTYVHEWKRYVERIGRWVDFDGAYKTMDASYTESVWWAIKQIHEKGMLYEGRKVLLYCPRCETPLSRAEIAMDDSYKNITEEAVTIKFKVERPEKYDLPENIFLLAWTTTPWTLPANVALAVGSEIEYSVVKKDGEHFIIASALAEKVFGVSQTTIKKMFGRELHGILYEPLYDIPKVKLSGKRAWFVSLADFVSTEEGTGIVHTAVIYGEDDYQLGISADLPMVPLLLSNGHYNNDAPEFIRGLYIKKAEKIIIEDLEKKGLLFAKTANTHSYPHCYRCDTPLIYNAISSWFIDIQKIKKEMIRLNENINWVPEHLKHGRFLDIVENAPDWTISRNRFWASPLPIWKCQLCQKIHVVGSLTEMKQVMKKSGNTYMLMRHGQSISNEKNTINTIPNTDDDQLTKKGRQEVVSVAKTENIADIIVSSEFRRSKETAKILAEVWGIPENEIIVDSRLNEFSVINGTITNWTDYWQTFPDVERRYNQEMSSENYSDARKRMINVLEDLEKNYSGKKILIVSHQLPIKLLLAGDEALNLNEELKNFQSVEDIENAKIIPLEFFLLPRDGCGRIDFHRPYIDEIKIVCHCGGEALRISEVIDCWVESGSMPFAEYNYPRSKKEEFEKRTPGNFVAEYIAQTRTWFYYMHVLSTALFGHEPFKNVVTTGTVLTSDGSKMSKSRGNFTDPMKIINLYGSDALRFYLMTSPVMQAEDLNFKDDQVKEVQQKMLNILRNVLSFYEMYKSDLPDSKNLKASILEKWIMSRLFELRQEVTANLDSFNTVSATRPIKDFIIDLSIWYLRRSRGRFKSSDMAIRKSAIYHTSYVLIELSKIIAPFMPFIAEEIYQKLKTEKDKESVHLESWPKSGKVDKKLIDNMQEARAVVTKALELRQRAGIKVRQPLQKLKVKSEKLKEELVELIKDEINVKEITFDQNLKEDFELDTEITEELKEEGIVRDIIRSIQDARKDADLSPKDVVSLVVTIDEETKKVIEKNLKLIQSTTSIKEIKFSSGEFSISIIRN